ncbi:MAG: bis(5'-nucleosyl)-tetraphosphatase (symmetrical) YqeK [Erysipelotrichaceae bacterium]
MTDIEYFEKLIKERLSEHRFNHSLLVAKLAKELAISAGEDGDKAYLSGILHDLTKEEKEEFHDNIFRKYNDLDKLSEALPIKHSHSCPYYLYETYGIDDKELLTAIYNHTVCRSTTALSKILYIADKREESRHIDDDVVSRSLNNLDEGFEYLIKLDKEYLRKKGIIA